MFFRSTTKGYSLVEALVAIAVLLLALVGPMTIATKSLKSSQYAKENAIAIFLAQEGIEAFISARNDALIQAVAARTLSTSWDWVTGIDPSCFTATGCNIDFSHPNPMDAVTACGVDGVGCELYFDSSDKRARYSLRPAGAVLSPYTRQIILTYDSTPGNKGIHITSIVSWKTNIFSGTTDSVILQSAIFSIYE